MSIEERIKTEAARLGFALCGIAAADAPLRYSEYISWLENDFHAGMDFMARPDAIGKRQDPRFLLPDCKTIICLAIAYRPNPSKPPSEPSCPIGTIAAYATYPDYHDILREKISQLQHFITDNLSASANYYIAVDTAPILEKNFFQQAGLGWIGRNSCLTSAGHGSWLLLGELLTTLPLQADQTLPSHSCQDCLRCMIACPTKALQPNYTVDARRCLSYLTIEHRGPISEEFRPKMGTRIFGCDTCQHICPHTSTNQSETVEFPIKPVLNPYVSLLEAFALTEAEFRQQYAGTPVLRARYQGFRRNVAIAMGNCKDPVVIPTLQHAAQNERDPIVREASAWSLSCFV